MCHSYGGPRVARRYLTRQEKIDRLQRYADALERELTAVRERVEDLGGAAEGAGA